MIFIKRNIKNIIYSMSFFNFLFHRVIFGFHHEFGYFFVKILFLFIQIFLYFLIIFYLFNFPVILCIFIIFISFINHPTERFIYHLFRNRFKYNIFPMKIVDFICIVHAHYIMIKIRKHLR